MFIPCKGGRCKGGRVLRAKCLYLECSRSRWKSSKECSTNYFVTVLSFCTHFTIGQTFTSTRRPFISDWLIWTALLLQGWLSPFSKTWLLGMIAKLLERVPKSAPRTTFDSFEFFYSFYHKPNAYRGKFIYLERSINRWQKPQRVHLNHFRQIFRFFTHYTKGQTFTSTHRPVFLNQNKMFCKK